MVLLADNLMSSTSSDIAKRLEAMNLPELFTPGGARVRVRQMKTEVKAAKKATRKRKSFRGVLVPEYANQRSVEQGRRRMSPYQAVALGSGRGVVINPDTANFVLSPQDVEIGWSSAHMTYSGFSTGIDEVASSPFVHINFPEWVR